MATIKKVCSKCGKTIVVDKFEYCCPLCGEFFEDMDNSQVLQHHADLETNERVEELREQNRRNRKSANKEGLLNWLKVLGISYLVMLVLAFFSIGSDDGGMGLMIFCIVAMACVVLAGPILPIVNLIRYNRKLNDEIIKIDGSHVEEKGRFSGVSLLSSICCVLMLLPVLVGFSLIINPIIVFQYLHYWVVVGIMCGYALIIVGLSLLSMKLYGKTYYEAAGQSQKGAILRVKGYISIFGVVLSLVLMLIGFFTIPNKTYTISTTQEFNILANMPSAGNCNYTLEADLDFEGKSSKGWSGITYFYGTFDGKGHTISNIKYEGNAKVTKQYDTNGYGTGCHYYSDGLVGVNYGTIKNIHFSDCVFKITYADSQNVSDAFLGTIAGENGGTIENSSIKNCFIEYKLKNKKRDGADFRFDVFVGINGAYGEKGHYLYDGPSYEGQSINNEIIYDKDFTADKGFTLVKYK